MKTAVEKNAEHIGGALKLIQGLIDTISALTKRIEQLEKGEK